MIKLLTGLLLLDHPYAENEQHGKYKIVFLNSVFLLASLIAFGMGFYRWQFSHLMGGLDFAFSLASIYLLVYLRGHKERVEWVSNVALTLSFLIFLALYLLAPYNTMRLSLFFLLVAAAFYLKGIRIGLYWLGISIFAIVGGHFLPGFETGYSLVDIVTTCLYLISLLTIFWNYETVREVQSKRDQEREVKIQIEERWRESLSHERELFQTILDNAPLGIWMVDPKGKVQFINRVFCNATGITEAQFLAANHYADVLPKSVSVNCIRSDQECMAQQAPHLSSECLPFVDGREHVLEITKVRLLNQKGEVKGVIGLAADVTERREHERQLEHIAHFDALTGAPNRVMLADRLQQALARTRREKGLMAVCYLDLDGFKPINDRFGHDEGDKVLVEITRRIKSVIRNDDTVARLGGDEFVVLLVGMKVAEECIGTLQRLLDVINLPLEIRGRAEKISASIGVSLYPEDMQDADTLLRHADQAMYVAKQSGKNRYHLFDAVNDQRTRKHNALLLQIRHGLENDEFELYYQPKVEMRTGHLVGAEALIRWNHPVRGLLQPGEFLRAIENTELDILLGEWVIRRALAQSREWRDQGFELALSINISAYHLQTPDFVEKLRAEMGSYCPKNCVNCLQIEVLETVAIEDISRISELISACREIGVGFALDDFGTGYSSLTYLNRLAVDTLKIDQSFVRQMLEEKGDHAIVQGIIALAHAFGRDVVAEGVETAAHYQALLEMGCEIGQGYGIARPMPADEIVKWKAGNN